MLYQFLSLMQFLLGGFAILFWKIKSGGVQASGMEGGGAEDGRVFGDSGWREQE